MLHCSGIGDCPQHFQSDMGIFKPSIRVSVLGMSYVMARCSAIQKTGWASGSDGHDIQVTWRRISLILGGRWRSSILGRNTQINVFRFPRDTASCNRNTQTIKLLHLSDSRLNCNSPDYIRKIHECYKGAFTVQRQVGGCIWICFL